MVWVLIIWIHSSVGHAVTTQGFSSKNSCIVAGDMLQAKDSRITTFCAER